MSQKADASHINEDSKPYTHLNYKNDPDEFQFAFITDNAGVARPGRGPPRAGASRTRRARDH